MGERLVVVGLGDSTTAGTPAFLSPLEAPPSGMGNPESQYGYWVTKAHPGWRFLNKGINGQRTDQMLSRFGRDVILAKPDIVVILGGVNDIYQGRGPGSVSDNLQMMYERAEASGIAVVGATILPYNSAGARECEAIHGVNSWIEERSKSSSMLFCDTNKAARDSEDPDTLSSTPDGLHPDVEGYRKMGEAVVKTLADAGY
jgi:lysophospholipase L1-like esterase